MSIKKGILTKEFLLFDLLCFLWGTTWLAIKFVLKDFPPIFGVGFRFTLAVILMASIVGIKHAKIPRRISDHLKLAFVGILSFCLSYVFVYSAEVFISSGLTSVLFATFPFFVAIFSHFIIDNESMNRWKLAGVATGFIGVTILFYHDISAGRNLAVGIILVLLASLVSAISNVYGKTLLQRIPLVVFNSVAMFYGTVAVWIAYFVLERNMPIHWGVEGISATLYLSVFGTVIPFLGYFWLIKHIDTTRVAMLTFITPVIALILGWIVLNEAITKTIFTGSVLILGGILLTLKGSKSNNARI